MFRSKYLETMFRGNTVGMYGYVSDADSIDDMLAVGYFDAANNQRGDLLKRGDFMLLTGSDGVAVVAVTKADHTGVEVDFPKQRSRRASTETARS